MRVPLHAMLHTFRRSIGRSSMSRSIEHNATNSHRTMPPSSSRSSDTFKSSLALSGEASGIRNSRMSAAAPLVIQP